MSIELGPFQLIRPIGKGGMGVVWEGIHVSTGLPVAVKVITQRVSRDAKTLAAFRNEVRAVAALDHPGVVWVLDFGEVSREASIASERQLTEGSPYLVMEMATGGTLSAFKQGLPWVELRGMLLSLLDALAHAHARGVIHRDLKPGNVLVCGPGDVRPGLKLTDFGIAHAREETVSDSMSNHVIGTLHYMAPEQVRADWRDYGPWTDLYALGTIAYKLAAGILPYKGRRGATLMVAQLNHRPPPLESLHPVPDGFEDWLLTMLRKEHWRRFQCAADAALALAALPEVEDKRIGITAPVQLPVMFVEEHATAIVLEDEPMTMELLDDGGEVTATGNVSVSIDTHGAEGARLRGELDRLRPPVAPSWRRPDRASRGKLRLKGAGLGLWGLRSLPLVGRESERDALWAALKKVAETKKPVVRLLKGGPGVGKTALMRWVTQRAVETGAAHVLRCDFAQDQEPWEGIKAMLGRLFRLTRLNEEQRRQRVLDVCDAFGETDAVEARRVERLFDAVDPLATDGGERHRVLRWLIAKVAGDRPLILWFDDAHWGMDGLQLTLSIVRELSSRVLVVVAFDPGPLSKRTLERSLLTRISKSDACESIEVGVLPDDRMTQHVTDDLGLERRLAEKVVAKAGGVPQFATQLLGDWVERGALDQTAEGYVLKPGHHVPETLGEVIQDRVEQLLEGLDGIARDMLQLAALCGEEVDDTEWSRVCDDPDGSLEAAGNAPLDRTRVRVRAELTERLLQRRLAEEREDGFAFKDSDFRTTLIEQSREAGTLASQHRRMAAMLKGTRAGAERHGQHLIASGQLDAGIDAMLLGVSERLATLGPRPALALLQTTEKTMSDARVPRTDARWGRIWQRAGRIAVQRGRLDEALKTASQMVDAGSGAAERGWSETAAQGHFIRAAVALVRKEVEPLHAAVAGFEGSASPSRLRLERAALHHALSLTAEAAQHPERAQEEASTTADYLQFAEIGLVDAWQALGMKSLLASRTGTLLANLERRRSAYEKHVEAAAPLAEAWKMLAGVSRRARQTGLAARCLQHAVRLFEAAGDPRRHRAILQMAMLRLMESDYDAAEAFALQIASEVADAHRKPLLLRAHAVLAVSAAGRGRWTLLGDHLAAIEQLSRATATAERDLAWCLAKVAEMADQADRSGLLERAARLAVVQYSQLGETNHVRRLRRLLA